MRREVVDQAREGRVLESANMSTIVEWTRRVSKAGAFAHAPTGGEEMNGDVPMLHDGTKVTWRRVAECLHSMFGHAPDHEMRDMMKALKLEQHTLTSSEDALSLRNQLLDRQNSFSSQTGSQLEIRTNLAPFQTNDRTQW